MMLESRLQHRRLEDWARDQTAVFDALNVRTGRTEPVRVQLVDTAERSAAEETNVPLRSR